MIRSGDCRINFETCSKLEEQNLDMIMDSDDTEDESEFGDALSARCLHSLSFQGIFQFNDIGYKLHGHEHGSQVAINVNPIENPFELV